MWTRHLKKYQIVTAHVFIFCVKNLRQAFSKKSVSQIRKNPRVNHEVKYIHSHSNLCTAEHIIQPIPDLTKFNFVLLLSL